jgi:hypothetical protein
MSYIGLQTCRDDKGKMIDSTQMNSSDATARCKSSTTNPYTLLTNNDLLGADLTNPQTTKDDGYFSFIVPDGFYKLTVSQANYTFPDTNGGNSTQNGGKFPYSDIYPAKTGEVIVQQGAIQHRDIPMTPKTGTGINYPIKIVTKYQDVLQKNNITQIVDGKVSHPYAYINICSVGTPSSKPIDTIQADARGYFKKAVDVSTVNIAQYPLRLVPKKNNDPDARSCPTALSFVEWLKSFITVNAQEDDALTRMDPILNNIEGYAYDSAGNKLVNTKVDIYVSFSSKPYYSTTTDANGYYKISSENLPSFQYSIKYTTKTGTVSTVTTSDFIAKNKEYIQKNNTDLMAYKDNQGNVLVSSGSTGGKASGNKPTIPFATVQPGQNTGDATGNGGNQSNATTTNNGGDNYLLILSLMVILLLAVAGGLVFYMQKKKAAKPPQR